jgi:hypothetical protein
LDSKYLTFLEQPHNIQFDVKKDFVDVASNKVTRLLNIEIRFLHNTFNLGQLQPAHLVYEVDPVHRKITSLRANWEFAQAGLLGSNLLSKLLSAVLMSFAGTAPIVFRFGLLFLLRMTYALRIGPLYSGGKALSARLIKAVATGNQVGVYYMGCIVFDCR